jgi:hypothetical protein
MHATVDFALQKTRRLEHTEVLRYRRQRYVEGFCQLRHERFALTQPRDNGAARWFNITTQPPFVKRGIRSADLF